MANQRATDEELLLTLAAIREDKERLAALEEEEKEVRLRLSANLKSARLGVNLPLSAVAATRGVTKAYFHQVENGVRPATPQTVDSYTSAIEQAWRGNAASDAQRARQKGAKGGSD